MSDQITVTSIIGPDVDVTAQVFTNVSSMTFDVARGVLSISYISAVMGPKTVDVSLSSITTVTYSISSGVATVTVS